MNGQINHYTDRLKNSITPFIYVPNPFGPIPYDNRFIEHAFLFARDSDIATDISGHQSVVHLSRRPTQIVKPFI